MTKLKPMVRVVLLIGFILFVGLFVLSRYPFGDYTLFPNVRPPAPSRTSPATRWVYGIPCELPCWEGMHIGETTLKESKENMRGIEAELYNRWGMDEWTSFYYLVERYSVRLTFDENDILVDIRIGPDPNNANTERLPICLDHVLKTYDDPSHVRTGVFGYSKGYIFSVNIFWLDQDFRLSRLMSPTMNIDSSLCYFNLSIFDLDTEWLDELDSQSSYASPEFGRGKTLEWDGYGTFEEYMTEELPEFYR